jgi:ribosomal protein S6
MERNMRISEDVIRLMSVRVETISEAPSAIMNFRNYRDEGSEGTADVESSAA